MLIGFKIIKLQLASSPNCCVWKLASQLLNFINFDMTSNRTNGNESTIIVSTREKITTYSTISAIRTLNITVNYCRVQPAKFNWTSMEKGFILSAFFTGSIFTFLCGPLIHKVGGARIVGIACILTAIIELTSPFQFVTNVYVFIIGRVFVGFCGVSNSQFDHSLSFQKIYV